MAAALEAGTFSVVVETTMPATPPQPLPSLPSSETILATIQHLNEEHSYLLDDIIQNVKPSAATFQNILRPIADIDNLQSGERHVIAALRYASPDLATQHAVEEAEKLDLEYQASIDKRSDFFSLIQAVKMRGETLEDEDDRLLQKTLLRFTKSGFGKMDAEELQEWHEMSLQVRELCTEFNRNIREYKGGLFFTADELSGIPKPDLRHLAPGENGTWYVPLRRREVLSVLRHGSSPLARKRIQRAWGEHLSENILLFKRATLLRDRKARLLGYGSHAESVLSDRMAPSVQWVAKLLQDLADHLKPAGREEFADIRMKKYQHISGIPGTSMGIEEVHVEPWDILYYRRMLEDELAINHDQIKEYFPLIHTCNAMLELFATYFQLRFEELSAQEKSGHTWTGDISVWAVWDDRMGPDGPFIGYLYADLLDRPNKYKGNQAVRLQPGYLKPNGERMYPVSTIMCSFQTSATDPCRLLEHSQLRSLFHELGHCMHDLLAQTKYQQFHGYNVCLEFGEAIGIMLENWVWKEDVLCSLSCHYTKLDPNLSHEWKKTHPVQDLPPAKVPIDLLAPLLTSFKRTRATQHLQQLYVFLQPYEWHSLKMMMAQM